MRHLGPLGLIAATIVGLAAQAAAQPYRLVCFGRPGLNDSLDKVRNPSQFLQNDRILRNGSCSFAQIPSGSTALYAGIHSSPRGFLFPIYQITYATTGQRMYAPDGIFRSDAWQALRLQATDIDVLTPSSCDVLSGYVQAQAAEAMPQYIYIPQICRVEVIR